MSQVKGLEQSLHVTMLTCTSILNGWKQIKWQLKAQSTAKNAEM